MAVYEYILCPPTGKAANHAIEICTQHFNLAKLPAGYIEVKTCLNVDTVDTRQGMDAGSQKKAVSIQGTQAQHEADKYLWKRQRRRST